MTLDRSLATSLPSNTPGTLFVSRTDNGFPSFTDEKHSEDPLALLLSNLLRFIERDLRMPIEIAERINSDRTHKSQKGRGKSRPTPAVDGKPSLTGEGDSIANGSAPIENGFDIMARVVWAEIGRALIDQLGPIIFAAGRPDEFQKVGDHLG